MSAPVLVATLSLVAGIALADLLFYEASVAVPPWLGASLWGFCSFLTLAAVWLYRRSLTAAVPPSRLGFALLTALFFATLGFARYASEARRIQVAWAQMARPPANRGNPDEFDYRRWRWLQGMEAAPASPFGLLRSRALSLRERLVRRYASAGLDEESLSLAVAVTLGDRSLLRRQTRDLYAEAGASHLLALSGLHLGILVGLLLTWMNGRLLLSRWRPWVGVAALLLVWTFAFVAALPASLVRAALMTSILIVASLMQRRSSPFHLLVLTALMMLLCRPFYLFDVGAQLSFAAIGGILLLHPRVVEWGFSRWTFHCYWLQRHHLLWPLELFSVSCSAWVFTLPLVAIYFHRISLYAPLFSIVFIPLTTAFIYVALLLLALGSLVPPFTAAAAVVVSCLVAAQVSLMRFQVSLPGAVVPDFWSRKAEPQLVVYHNRRCPALHLIASPSQSWLLMPQPDSLETGMSGIASSFWRRRLTAPPVLLRGRHTVAAAGIVAVMVDKEASVPSVPSVASVPSVVSVVSAVSVASVDLLWLTSGFRGTDLRALATAYHPRLLVLDASLRPRQRALLAAEAKTLGWAVYDVAVQGALQLKLPPALHPAAR